MLTQQTAEHSSQAGIGRPQGAMQVMPSGGKPARRWVEPVTWASLAIALIIAALPTLLYPLTRDQGIYAYIADLMRQGGAPFRDAWELKPPAVYFVYQLAFLLFGRSELGVRLFDVLYALVSAGAVCALAWEAFRDRHIAVLSGWLYAFCYYFMVHFHSMATPEAFMTPFLLISIYGLLRGARKHSRPSWLFGGVAGGFVFWFKPTAGLPILAVLIWACVELWRERLYGRAILSRVAVFALGGMLGLLPIGLYLYGHGLREMLEIWSAYGAGAYLEAPGLARGSGILAMLDVIVAYMRDWQLLLWLSLTGAIGAFAWRRRNRNGEALVLFWLFSALATLVQGKLFEYHWIPVLAPTVVLSAMSLVWIAQHLQERLSILLCDMRNIFVVVVIIGLVMWLGYDRIVRYRSALAYVTGRLSAERYYAQFNIGQDFSPTATRNAAAYLRTHTQPGETVLIWGVEPLVNFLAERRSPTNFISFYVLVTGKGRNPRLEAWRQDFLEDIRRTPPTYIVLVNNDISPLAPYGSRVQLSDFPAFKTIVETEYEFETQLEDYLFYRRRQ